MYIILNCIFGSTLAIIFFFIGIVFILGELLNRTRIYKNKGRKMKTVEVASPRGIGSSVRKGKKGNFMSL